MIENAETIATNSRRELAVRAIREGIEAAHPDAVVPGHVSVSGERLTVGGETVDLTGVDRLVVLGGGNGAGRMAAALESVLAERIDGGLVVTDDPAETAVAEVREGTHPLPSRQNREATTELLERARKLGENDLALVVISGGGSALLTQPVGDLSLQAYREVTTALVESGATIDEINAVRKHLSQIKGGRLAATLAPASIRTLVISDVVGNRLDVVASGPTTPDPSTYDDALTVLDRYDVAAPTARRILDAGVRGDRSETPTAGNPIFDGVDTHVLADNRTALDAAADVCGEAGYLPLVFSSRIEGEASEVGVVHAGIATECAETGTPIATPAALLSGGEATVTVTGDGRGGPNQEFALGAGLTVETDALVVGVDTDGIDGSTDAAGAIVDASTVTEKNAAQSALDRNDAYSYLATHDGLVRTDHTGTNVNDLRLVLVGEP
jgi:glycerate 2-kinase